MIDWDMNMLACEDLVEKMRIFAPFLLRWILAPLAMLEE